MNNADLKRVKRRKEKERELDGIDTSNIIQESSGRRSRAAARPQVYAEEDSEEEDEDDGDEEDSEEGDEGNEEDNLSDDG